MNNEQKTQQGRSTTTETSQGTFYGRNVSGNGNFSNVWSRSKDKASATSNIWTDRGFSSAEDYFNFYFSQNQGSQDSGGRSGGEASAQTRLEGSSTGLEGTVENTFENSLFSGATVDNLFSAPSMGSMFAGTIGAQVSSTVMSAASSSMANQTREGLGPSGHDVLQEVTASMQQSDMSLYSGLAGAVIAGGSLLGPEGALAGIAIGAGIDAVGYVQAQQEDAMVDTTSGS